MDSPLPTKRRLGFETLTAAGGSICCASGTFVGAARGGDIECCRRKPPCAVGVLELFWKTGRWRAIRSPVDTDTACWSEPESRLGMALCLDMGSPVEKRCAPMALLGFDDRYSELEATDELAIWSAVVVALLSSWHLSIQLDCWLEVAVPNSLRSAREPRIMRAAIRSMASPRCW